MENFNVSGPATWEELHIVSTHKDATTGDTDSYTTHRMVSRMLIRCVLCV